MYLTPVVIEQSSKGERSYDIFSRLLKDRIIIVAGEIDKDLSVSTKNKKRNKVKSPCFFLFYFPLMHIIIP